MNPTQVEQLLIDYLKLYKIGKGKRAVVFLTLENEEQMLTMLEFLRDNEEATEDQIMAEARRIAEK